MRIDTITHWISKRKTNVGSLTLMLFVGGLSQPVMALEGQIYGGIAGGTSTLRPETGTTGHEIDDDSDGAIKFFVGYDLTDYLSLEAFYGSYGEASLIGPADITSTSTGIAGLGDNNGFLGADAEIVEGTVGYSAFGAYGVIQFPDNGPGFSGILKLGVANISSDTNGLPFTQAEETQFTTAFGLEYQLKNGVAARAEFDYINEHVQAINLSILKRFGKPKQALKQVVPPKAQPKPQVKPAAKAPAQKPAAKPAAAPKKPVAAAPKAPAAKPVAPAPVQVVAPVAPVQQQAMVAMVPQHVMTFTDSDLDGISDSTDQCPQTSIGVVVNAQGCSYTTSTQAVSYMNSGGEVLNGVTFHPGSARLTSSAKDRLVQVAASLINSSAGIIAVVGHTDNQGSAASNLKLSQNRAIAVAEYLAANGVDAQRLRYAGKGEDVPMTSNATAEGRALNRRVELFQQY